MLEIPRGQTTDADQLILQRLRVWIAALTVVCLVVGIGIGVLLTGQQVVAQNEKQIERAPAALSASFAEIARRVEPAVVNIETVSAPQIAGRAGSDSEEDEDEKEGPSDSPLMEMFRRHHQQRRPSRGVGSGFVIDPKGLILTNQHVIDGATGIMVKLQSGEKLRGSVVGIDELTDLAVIQVKPTNDLPAVKLGNSDDAQVGDWVLAIGSPFGLEQTVTAGIISTRERTGTPGASSFQRFLQTDAAINRGNSGGPLVNMRGEVIGINSQIATSTGDYNGIGFALPANEANFVYGQIIAGRKVRRGYLGIFLEPVKSEYARVFGLSEAKGAIVRDMADPKGPAVKAGMQINDVIVELNGQQVLNAQDLINRVAAVPVGQNVQVTYLREVGSKFERRTANVVIGERPRDRNTAREDAPKEKSAPSANDRPPLGLTLSELTPQIANEKNLKGVRGLLIKDIDEGGLVFDTGLSEGMVIQRVNRVSVSTLAEFEKVISSLKPGDAVVMNLVYYDVRETRLVQRIVQFTYQ